MRNRLLVALGGCLLSIAVAPAQEPFRVGNGVTAPRLVRKVEPQYSEEARKARLNGTVLLYAVVHPDGRARDMRVLRSLGLGLDENAIAAVGQWEFQPGEKEGKTVSVAATIEVNFRLLPGRGFDAGWYLKSVKFQLPGNTLRPVIIKSP